MCGAFNVVPCLAAALSPCDDLRAPRSDVPIKEFILSLNNGRPEGEKFIIEELGDTQLFVKSGCLSWLREELEKFQDKNTYEVHLPLTATTTVLVCDSC